MQPRTPMAHTTAASKWSIHTIVGIIRVRIIFHTTYTSKIYLILMNYRLSSVCERFMPTKYDK